jgi:hypothetical protein
VHNGENDLKVRGNVIKKNVIPEAKDSKQRMRKKAVMRDFAACL